MEGAGPEYSAASVKEMQEPRTSSPPPGGPSFSIHCQWLPALRPSHTASARDDGQWLLALRAELPPSWRSVCEES